jgi:hypothetical protein
LLAIALVLTFVKFELISNITITSSSLSIVGSNSFYLIALFILVMVLGILSFSIIWHRRILLGESINGVPISFSGRTFVYLARLMVILVISSIFAVIMSMLQNYAIASIISDHYLFSLSYILSFIASVWFSIPLLRYCLSLPSAALGKEETNIIDSFRETQGSTIRLVAIFVVIFIPFKFSAFVLDWATIADDIPHLYKSIAIFVGWVLVGLQGILFLTLSSILYSFFSEREALPDSSGAPCTVSAVRD